MSIEASSLSLQALSGGNVLIGTTTDSGFKLQVDGEGRFYQPATNSSAYLRVENNRARNAAVRLKTTVGDFYIGTGIGVDVNQFQIYDGNAGDSRLTISSTGAATFSNSVTAGGQISTSYASFNSPSKIVITNTETTGQFASSALELRTWDGAALAVGTSLFQTFGGPFNYAQLIPNQTNLYAVKAGGFRLATTNAPIVFATGNADTDFSPTRMTITSGGSVGIGTGSPSSRLHVISALGTVGISLGESGNNQRLVLGQESSYTGNYINSTNIDLKLITYRDGGTGGTMLFYTSADTNPVERMRITTSGVMVNQGGVYDTGTSNPWIARQGGNNRIIADATGYVYMPFLTTGSGIDTLGWWGSSSSSWTYNGMLMRISSSARYKKNIRDLELDSTKIFDLRTISYENNENTAIDGLTSFGLLAEDVAEKIPKLATYNDNNQPEGVQYNMLSVLLLEEMKKMRAELDILKNKQTNP
jgi:hypothetical protein